MRMLKASLIIAPNQQRCMEVTWEIRHFWPARLLWGLPKRETVVVVYVQHGNRWRFLETYKRVPEKLESILSEIEGCLVAYEALKWQAELE